MGVVVLAVQRLDGCHIICDSLNGVSGRAGDEAGQLNAVLDVESHAPAGPILAALMPVSYGRMGRWCSCQLWWAIITS